MEVEDGSVAGAAEALSALRQKAQPTAEPAEAEDDSQAESKLPELNVEEPEGEEPTKPSEPAQDEFAEIELDGGRYKIPKEIEKHFMLERDYRVKTGKHADEVRKWESDKESYIKSATQAYKEEVQRLQQLLSSSVVDEDSMLAKLLEEENYPEYIRQKHLAEQRKITLNKANDELRNQQLQQFQDYFQKQQEQLHAKLPEWKDPEKAKKQFDSMSRFLQSEGFSQEEIGRTYDHRLYLISLKAMKFDELEKAKKDAVKKIEKLPPKAERPGVPSAANGVASKDALSRLRKTGSLDDAAAAIRSLRAGNA